MILTADDRFAYDFTAFAFSGLPVEVLRFTAHRPVHRRHPPVPGARHRRCGAAAEAFDQASAQGEGDGVIAAWAADEETLGHGARVSSTIARLERQGRLRNTVSITSSTSASRFVSALFSFLRKNGYITGG